MSKVYTAYALEIESAPINTGAGFRRIMESADRAAVTRAYARHTAPKKRLLRVTQETLASAAVNT